MKSILSYTLLAAVVAAGVATAETTATTTPVGYLTVECLPGSDTLVGVPLQVPTVSAALITTAPSIDVGASTAVISVASGSFTAGAFANTHYIRLKSGTADGKYYSVLSNTDSSITIDLEGDSFDAVTGDKFSVIKYWTLADLFDPALSTQDAATTLNAIVASGGATANTRKTEILLPNKAGVGVNLSAAGIFYINGGTWRKQGSGSTNFNSQQLLPDSYFIIRHPSSVGSATKYVVAGEVDTGKNTIPLYTRSGNGNKQDNPIALARPIDMTLNELGLGGTPAFVSSAGGTAASRRDELLVFNNAVSGLNKSAASVYYYRDGKWNKQGSGTADVGADVIPAGAAIMIRKYETGAGETVFWSNAPTYAE